MSALRGLTRRVYPTLFCSVPLFFVVSSASTVSADTTATVHTESLAKLANAEPPNATPEVGDWLVWRLPAEMPHLNPLTSSDYYASVVMSFLFDGLLWRNPETLAMEPHVATSWEISEDHLEYTFHLRRDVQFWDGTPLTAHDVKFTFDTLMNPTTDAAALRNYFKDVSTCEVLDDYTVRYRCTQPYVYHLNALGSLEILPRHIYGEGDFNKHRANRAPMGSGPYRFIRWVTGRYILLERNPAYWKTAINGEPYLERILFRFITNDNAAMQLLMRGDLDRSGILPQDWERRANTPKFIAKFHRFQYFRPGYTYIGWNLRLPLFSDKRVRQALTMLLDRETICATILEGFARVAAGTFMFDTPEENPRIQPYPFDPKHAVALLEEAGWRDTNGDGLRDRDGRPFRFEVLLTNNNPTAERILTVYKEELARHGIELVLRPLEWAAMVERVDARNFEAVIMGWALSPDPDPYQLFHSSQAEKGSNYVGFADTEADRLMEEARVTFDREKRIAMYHRLSEILHEEQPYTFLMVSKQLLAVDKRFENIHIYPFGPDEREWFVPKAAQRYVGF